ncbi:MAG: NHLP bacteriocin system secretion protein [Burkholderiales bacterium]
MSDIQAKLFRKVALERLSSPEQLDRLMQVITPQAWVALAPLAALILLAMVWGWFGSIPTKVNGKCILINPSGLADLGASSAGRVLLLNIKVGDLVKRGQVIAEIAQPEAADRIEKAEAKLRDLEAQGRSVRSFAQQGTVLNAQSLAQQQQNLEAQLRSAQQKGRVAADRQKVQEELLAQGLVTNQTVLTTRQEVGAAELEAENLQNQIKQLSLRKLDTDKQSSSEVSNIELQVAQARRDLDSLVANRKLTTQVLASVEGRVVEVKAAPGSLVTQGASLGLVEQSGDAKGALTPASAQGAVQALIYVAAADGKQILSGMQAQIVPSTVKREEYGFMLGKISYVSEYPSTPQSMNMLLQNDALVRDLAGASPPVEVRALLTPADNYSGYTWSSAAGAPVKVKAGTVCTSEIVVRTQKPVSLVIPILKKSLSLD